jgi:hypothetical protein
MLDVLYELGLSAERQQAIVREHPRMRRTASLTGERLVAAYRRLHAD